jgi:hypothetical protein
MQDKFIIFTFLLFNSFFVNAQDTRILKYAIITCKIDRNKDAHSYKEYFWIVPIDSIKGINSFKIYPLYLDVYAKDDISDCIQKKDINIFTMYTGKNFKLDDKSEKDNLNIIRIIKKDRRRFFKLYKKWNNGLKEKIELFVTPIRGEFCSSNIALESSKEINYKGLIFIPITDFKEFKEFFDSKQFNDVIFSEFSNINFANSN